ncbi:hypothetical protein EON68_02490, partial [archaeon]
MSAATRMRALLQRSFAAPAAAACLWQCGRRWLRVGEQAAALRWLWWCCGARIFARRTTNSSSSSSSSSSSRPL